jgi:uncharacterized membrane protein YsdA (DUF1294 family)
VVAVLEEVSPNQMSIPAKPDNNRVSRSGGVTAPAFILLALLLAVPAYALSRLTTWIDWRVLVAAPIVLSVITFFVYRTDKRRAEAGEWRIPESTLHFAELIGGWPGAFLAQRQYRHKTSKTSFQVIFWAIVLIHQFAAVDSLAGWRFTKDALRYIGAKSSRRHHGSTGVIIIGWEKVREIEDVRSVSLSRRDKRK